MLATPLVSTIYLLLLYLLTNCAGRPEETVGLRSHCVNGSSQSVTIKDGAAYIHATSGDEGPYDFICPDRKTLMVAEYQITRKNCIKGIFTYVFEVIFPLVDFDDVLTIHHGLKLTHFTPEIVNATELQLLLNGSDVILTGDISAGSGWSDGIVTILSCLDCAKPALNESDWPLYITHNITQPGLNTFTVIVENPCGEKRIYTIEIQGPGKKTPLNTGRTLNHPNSGNVVAKGAVLSLTIAAMLYYLLS